MRILVVGEYMWPWYQEAFKKALEELGMNCDSFSWFDKFWIKNEENNIVSRGFMFKIQYRTLEGPLINKVNNELIQKVETFNPDLIFFYNSQLISNKTILHIKKNFNSKLCQYTNDDPFSFKRTRGIWRKFINNIPLMDYHFIFRESNRENFIKHGASKINLLMPYFIPEKDFPMSHKEIPEQYKTDIVFAGHYENDGRINLLEAILQKGYSLKLYGGGWNKPIKKLNKNSLLKKQLPVRPVIGDEYRMALNGAKACICFLSKINNDKYTRRCFEIPAMKKILVAEYTDELNSIFTEDQEAIYFRDTEELLNKLEKIFTNQDLIDEIQNNAIRKVYDDGHDIKSRAKQFLNFINDN